MKLYRLIILLCMASQLQKVESVESVKKLFGFDKNQPRDYRGGDTVAFWTTIIDLLKSKGYSDDSEFVKHARTNLRAAQTRREHATGRSTVSSLAGLAGYKEKAKLPKEKKAEKKAPVSTAALEEAFKKGKKSGEARERRLLRKKAEQKKEEERKAKRKK